MTHFNDYINFSTTTISPIALFVALRYGVDVPLEDLKSLYLSAIELARSSDELSDVVRHVLVEEGQHDMATLPSFTWLDSGLQIRHLSAVEEAQFEVIKSSALITFRQAVATPEQRLQLATQYSFEYDMLTSWVIRADLMRIGNMDTEAARLLASAGIMGVHDLALCQTSHKAKQEERVKELAKRAEEALKPFFTHGLDSSLKEILLSSLHSFVEEADQLAKEQPAQIVTGTEVVILATAHDPSQGKQAQDHVKEDFLKTLSAAVKSIDPQALISQREDICQGAPSRSPKQNGADDSSPQPPLTEIRTGERRIWIKQVECAADTPSAAQAMDLEWGMATYRFASLIHDLIGLRNKPPRSANLEHTLRQAQGSARSAIYMAYLGIFAYLFFTHWNFISSWSTLWLNGTLDWMNLPTLNSTLTSAITFGLGMTVSALLALIPSRRQAGDSYPSTLRQAQGIASSGHRQNVNDPLGSSGYINQNDAEKSLNPQPALPKWLLIVLMASFVINPVRYGIGLLVLMLVVQGLLLARDCAWPYRKKAAGDGTGSEQDVQLDQNGKNQTWHKQLILSPLAHRYLVVLGIPVTRVIYWITYPLCWIPFSVPLFGKIGPAIRRLVGNMFGSGLSVSAVSDPAQAERIRQAIESDVRFFHLRPDVNNIHVCAHSQSTLLTLDTLFQELPASFRGKIKSLLTTSSLQSYDHKVKPLLQEQERAEGGRFPLVAERPRDSDLGFARGFQWVNFWNSYDAVTEFYLLHDGPFTSKYNSQHSWQSTPSKDQAWPSDNNRSHTLRHLDRLGAPQAQGTAPPHGEARRQTRPINIKTRGHWFIPTAHKAYWRNMQEVQLPFAQRLLGHTECEQWAHMSDTISPQEGQGSSNNASYATYFFNAAASTIGVHLLLVGFWWLIAQFLTEYATSLPVYQNTVTSLSTSLSQSGLAPLLQPLIKNIHTPDFVWLLLLLLFLLLVSTLRPYYGKPQPRI
ncbi:MAG: DUF4332 domain-containing protein [Ardenticatenaceae bacterium]